MHTQTLMRPALAFALWLGATACAPSFAHFRQVSLAAKDGLACDGYAVWNNEPVTDVVLGLDGTGRGTSAFLPDATQQMLHSTTAAYVTFDKPGVHARFGDRARVHIDDATFARHTQGTLQDCAEQALHLADTSFGSRVRFHLRGHSEGTIIELSLLNKLLTEQPALARRVQTLVFSGLLLEPFAQNVERQLKDKPALWHAVQTCELPVLLRQMGVSCAYLSDAGARPSGFTQFSRLAAAALPLKVRIFQGSDDVNTQASFVHQLEAWNQAEGHLDLTVRYYAGGHAGTPEVRRELADLLSSLAPARR